MGKKDIRLDVLKQVVEDNVPSFATKDVSEDPRMHQAHPELVRHHNYHAFVGGALSDHRSKLGIVEVRKHTPRGSLWEKPLCSKSQARAVGSEVPLLPNRGTTAVVDLGPQCSGDATFKARMRLHQSWYRANVLRLACGTGPKPKSTSHYGNMLTREDGAAGRNFLTPEIAQVARDRLRQGGGAVEPFRLFHNMLSSQPMCFNLFGPLANDHALAGRLLGTVVPDGIAEVTAVALEWAPTPADEYLGDRTAFDAFIEYRCADGGLYALGVETKLTEPFSQKEYDGEHYRRWMRLADAPWRPDVDSKVHAKAHNQLWRDHLLAVAMRCRPGSRYAAVRLMVIRHPEDHECARVLRGYRQLLHDGDDTLIDMPLDKLIGRWEAVVKAGPNMDWLREFGVRYLELEKSVRALG